MEPRRAQLRFASGTPRMVLLALATGLLILVAVISPRAQQAEATGFLADDYYMCFEFFGPSPALSIGIDTKIDDLQGWIVREATLLCAPALVDGRGDLAQPHIRCHRPEIFSGGPGTPTLVPPQAIDVQTQFRVEFQLTVAVEGGVAHLCVPASIGAASFPALPKYHCYAVFSSNGDIGIDVSVATAYGTRTVTIERPRNFCASAILSGSNVPGGQKGSLDEPSLLCYQVTSPAFEEPVLTVHTQFVSPQVPTNLGQAELLCVGATQDISVGGVAEIDQLTSRGLAASESDSALPAAFTIALAAAAGLLLGAAALTFVRRSR